ncbi:immunoglobulin superfamily member 23 [Neovison vison]|uniref:immunoglobulin superfamily member 23 n=1 Tax=Neovison vison TaxID=452646 RepID=UPI001CF0814F|nr:immunoglobulin superfamily member 23 [Neogale vison]
MPGEEDELVASLSLWEKRRRARRGGQGGKRAKPQNLSSQSPIPACSPPTTTINPVMEKSAGLGGESPAKSRSQAGKQGTQHEVSSERQTGPQPCLEGATSNRAGSGSRRKCPGNRCNVAIGRGEASSNGVMLLTFPYDSEGIIQSDLNYSVILECLASSITPKPVLHWTFNGEPYQTGSRLIIRRLSWEHLGTYVCIAKNSQGQYSSSPVTLALPQDNVDPTDAEPIEPDPVLSVSGGGAIALLLAGNVGAAMLIGGIGFIIVQSIRSNRQRIRSCC